MQRNLEGHEGAVRNTKQWRRGLDAIFGMMTVGSPKQVWDCCFTPDSRLLVTAGEDGSIRLWEGNGYDAVCAITKASFCM